MQAIAPPTESIYRFGSTEIDRIGRVLRIDGQSVSLGARAFELLLALVERAGILVTKSELLRAVWADTVVGDFNLHVQISTLRKHLGPQSILTIPGRGYIFMLASSAARYADASAHPAPSLSTKRLVVESRSTLFGRDEDLQRLTQLIGQARLVTITGCGGIGKTQLARSLVGRLEPCVPHGVAIIDLTALTDPNELPLAIGAALQSPLGSQDPAAALVRAVRGLEALILLDNAEIMRSALISLIERMLDQCPYIRFIVTSQIPLKIPTEWQYRLEPLNVPMPGTCLGEALAFDGIALFQHRIRLVDRRFQLTNQNIDLAIRICRRLDGLPLAIELVAPRCQALGLRFIDQQLSDRFRWFRNPSESAPDRQRTLGTIMQWSYDLLMPWQQQVFRKLGVCSGSFTMEFAQRLLATSQGDGPPVFEILETLHDHGLIALEPGEPPRFRLLETARSFALEQLELCGESNLISHAYLLTVRSIFEEAYQDSWVMTEPCFLARYEPELDHLRSALENAFSRDPESAVALCGASAPLWRWLSMQHQALVYHEKVSQLDLSGLPLALVARFYCGIAMHYSESADLAGREPARRAIQLYERLGDRRGQYLAHAHLAYSYWNAEPGEASESLAAVTRLEDPTWPPLVRLFGARIERYTSTEQDRIAEGHKANTMRLTLATLIESEYEINSALVNLADFALMAGDAEDAIRRNRHLLSRLSRRHAAARAVALGNLLESLLAIDARAEARALVAEFNALMHQLDFMFGMFAMDGWALLAAREQLFCVAAHLLGYSDSAYTARHRGRGVNALRIRSETAQRLQAALPKDDLAAYLDYGASLLATQACSIVTQTFLESASSRAAEYRPPDQVSPRAHSAQGDCA